MNRCWVDRYFGLTALACACLTSPTHAQDKHPPPALPSSAEDKPLAQDDAAGFAEYKQWAISTEAALSADRRTQSRGTASTSFSIFPSADYFVVRNLSLGAGVGVGYQKADGTRSLILKVGPRIGFNFELTRTFSLWPKLGLSYVHTREQGSNANTSGDDAPRRARNNGIAMNLFAPFMVLPGSQLFVGFGPYLDTDLRGPNRATSWGLRLTMGGWIKRSAST